MLITYMNLLLGWNPLVMPKYRMADYDIVEIAALKAIFSDIRKNKFSWWNTLKNCSKKLASWKINSLKVLNTETFLEPSR